MLDAKKTVIISMILLIVAVPFIFKEKKHSVVPIAGADTLVIITAHNELLRREYTIGFKKWYKARTGKDVNIDWRYHGGARDASRYIESIYTNNFRLHWEENLHRQWDSSVAAAFAVREENMPGGNGETLRKEVSDAFFQSNVGCGVDIFFGGGHHEFEIQARRGNLIPCDLIKDHPEMFTEDTIPEYFCGIRLWDREGKWFGASLSAFGIIYNSEAILDDGIPFFPQTWMDIGRPEFFQKLAIVDPTKSSSVQRAFLMMVQQQMQLCYDELRSSIGVVTLSPEDEVRAISAGWINGLRLIQKIVANGRYFTESSTRPVIDVSTGNCLAGVAVDFYGLGEAKHLEERSGSRRFKFVMPKGGGNPNPDPIGIFRGTNNMKLAQEFIEFILSMDGQKILDFRLHTPGGPEKNTIRRVPILKTIYQPEYAPYRCDSSINPYNAGTFFTVSEDILNRMFNAMSIIIKLAFIDLNEELSSAMGAIIRARREGRIEAAEEAYAVLANMSGLNYEDVLSSILPVFARKNVLEILALQNKIGEKHRKLYVAARKIANGIGSAVE
jgi:ABC-type Fe3+ transport system substrate-binding protein